MTTPSQAYADRTVLVTGGAGAIGSNLTRALLEGGARVVVIDDLSASSEANVAVHERLRFIHGDILDPDALGAAFGESPEVVFHLAAFFANQRSVEHPEEDLRVNGMGILRVLEAAVAAGRPRVVYAGSGCSVYGNDAPLPLTEGTVSTYLDTPYQVTKLLGELYLNYFGEHYGLPVVKTRLFNSYGPWDPPGRYRNVIPNFMWRALHGLPLPLTGDGTETRDFTFVGDITDGLLRAGTSERAVGAEMNLATGREIAIGDLAHKINEAAGSRAGVEHRPPRAWDRKRRLLASVDRARDLLGYEPKCDFDEGLAVTAAWFRTHWSRLATNPRFVPPGVDPTDLRPRTW